MTANDIVTRYTEAFDAGDMETVRTLLADDFRFVGPLMRVDGADGFLTALGAMQVEARTTVRRVAAEGDTVSRTFDFEITAPVERTIPMAEWLEVRDGRIAAIELYYDSALFPTGD